MRTNGRVSEAEDKNVTVTENRRATKIKNYNNAVGTTN